MACMPYLHYKFSFYFPADDPPAKAEKSQAEYSGLPRVNSVKVCPACEHGGEYSPAPGYHYVEWVVGTKLLPAMRRMCHNCDFMWTERCAPKKQSPGEMKKALDGFTEAYRAHAWRTAPKKCSCACPS